MNIHEYQAKQLLRNHRVTTPAGDAETATAKLDAIEALGHHVVRNPADIGDTVLRAVKETDERGPSTPP